MASLLDDIMGFAMESLTKFGEKARKSNESTSQAFSGGDFDIDELLNDILQFTPLGITGKASKAAKGFVPPRGSVPPTKKVFKPQAQIAQVAERGSVPLSSTNKLLPALIDERTGEILHAMNPGPGFHDILRRSAPKNFMGTRGFVDPVTFQAFTEKMLDDLFKQGLGGLP